MITFDGDPLRGGELEAIAYPFDAFVTSTPSRTSAPSRLAARATAGHTSLALTVVERGDHDPPMTWLRQKRPAAMDVICAQQFHMVGIGGFGLGHPPEFFDLIVFCREIEMSVLVELDGFADQRFYFLSEKPRAARAAVLRCRALLQAQAAKVVNDCAPTKP